MPKPDLLDVEGYSESVKEIILSAPMPGLGEGPECAETRMALFAAGKNGEVSTEQRECGLWLLAGELTRSHDFSQSDSSAEGSYWHGIMHRREGDFSNAKYWFRRVGNHHVFAELATQVERNSADFPQDLPLADLSDPERVAPALVDAVESALSGNSEWQESLEKICWWEWQLLFAAS